MACSLQTATCADVGEWAYWRYWNATPNCCAYNWYVPGSYTEVSYEAPDHATYINNLIKYLKAEIRREKAKNYAKRKIMEEQKSKTEQRNLSKTLDNNFKECIDVVLKEKQ